MIKLHSEVVITCLLSANMEFPDIHSDAFETDKVYFHQEEVSAQLPHMERFHQVLRAMALAESSPLRELNYIFCTDAYLLQMNMTHLNHDYYTDVITFPHLPTEMCGDIYISVDRVGDNANKMEVTFERELLRVMLHGALHLAGYKDSTPKQKTVMRNKEDAYLEMFYAE